jgi:uncharacterized protein
MAARRVTSGLYRLQNDRPMIDGPLPAMEASRQRTARAREQNLCRPNRHRGKGRKIFQDFVLPGGRPNTLKSLAGPGAPMEGRADFGGNYSMDQDILRKLEERLGPLHARQRLGIETDQEAQIFGQSLLSFHIGNWYPVHSFIRNTLKLTGLYWRARRNTERILVKRNDVMFKELPPLFDGFTILHLSDMHVDMNEGAMRRVIELVDGMRYDLCVLTGDYRGKTFGPFAATLEGVARVRAHLKEPVYGVLGDHDTVQMVPGLEAMGIRILLNECAVIVRAAQQIYLAGIDDAHHFRVDSIEKAALQIPWRVLYPIVAHTGDLSPSGSCRF